MTCHRRYTFTFELADGHQHILDRLNAACERYWWFCCPEVQGAALGVLQAEFQVSARDQWFAHKRAMDLMTTVAWPSPVPVPTWETLPPHTNRGRYRVTQAQ